LWYQCFQLLPLTVTAFPIGDNAADPQHRYAHRYDRCIHIGIEGRQPLVTGTRYGYFLSVTLDEPCIKDVKRASVVINPRFRDFAPIVSSAFAETAHRVNSIGCSDIANACFRGAEQNRNANTFRCLGYCIALFIQQAGGCIGTGTRQTRWFGQSCRAAGHAPGLPRFIRVFWLPDLTEL
jgi:hypothetical protein